MAVSRTSPDANRALGRNISSLRLASGQSQEGLAEKLGVTARYLQKIEAGNHAPSLRLLVAIRSNLNADWGDLFRGL